MTKKRFSLSFEYTFVEGIYAWNRKKLKEYEGLPGAYVLKDKQGRPIYIGEAQDLHKRIVSDHLKGSNSPLGSRRNKEFQLIYYIELYVLTKKNHLKRHHLEIKLIQEYSKNPTEIPIFNKQFRPDLEAAEDGKEKDNKFNQMVDNYLGTPEINLLRRKNWTKYQKFAYVEECHLEDAVFIILESILEDSVASSSLWYERNREPFIEKLCTALRINEDELIKRALVIANNSSSVSLQGLVSQSVIKEFHITDLAEVTYNIKQPSIHINESEINDKFK